MSTHTSTHRILFAAGIAAALTAGCLSVAACSPDPEPAPAPSGIVATPGPILAPAPVQPPTAEPVPSGATYQLPPCVDEDWSPSSPNCYWDESTRGNHGGTSFIDFNGVTYYPSK